MRLTNMIGNKFDSSSSTNRPLSKYVVIAKLSKHNNHYFIRKEYLLGVFNFYHLSYSISDEMTYSYIFLLK